MKSMLHPQQTITGALRKKSPIKEQFRSVPVKESEKSPNRDHCRSVSKMDSTDSVLGVFSEHS